MGVWKGFHLTPRGYIMALFFKQFSAEAMVAFAPTESVILAADHWRVMEDFRYYLGDKNSTGWVDIPRGFLTDGATIPRIFWNLLPPWGTYGQAAIVHDFLCRYLTITKDGLSVHITRKQCDEILLEAMVVLGVPLTTRCAIYYAVCLYRAVSGIKHATNTSLYTQLEDNWLSRNKRGS
jgi:hypothetical protein